MKHIKILLLAVTAAALLAVPCAAQDLAFNADFSIGTSWGGSGSCLNDYNNCLRGCGPVDSFAAAGCKADCWVSYYDCVLASAIS
jgi:hypothetical protein